MSLAAAFCLKFEHYSVLAGVLSRLGEHSRLGTGESGTYPTAFSLIDTL